MATREEITQLGHDARRLLEAGRLDPKRLNEKGRLVLGIGLGSRGWDSLTRDEMLSLGVEIPPSLTERVTGAVGGAAEATGDYLSKLSGIVTEGIPAAARTGMETFRQPTESFHTFRRGLASEPVFGGPPHAPTMQERIEAFSPVSVGKLLFDAANQSLHAFGKAAAELGPEKAKPLTEAAAANLPFLGVRGPMAALAQDVRGLRGLVRRPPVPKAEAPPPPMLALPPGPETGFTVVPQPIPQPGFVPGEPIGLSRRGQARQKALPPVPSETIPGVPRPTRPFEEPPTLLPGRNIPADVDLMVKRPVEPPPKVVPTATEVAQKRAGIDPTIPSERPMTVLDAQGRPVMVPVRPAPKPPEPPAPAKLPPPPPVLVPPAAGPPPAPKAPLPSGPIAPPPKVPRPQRPKPDRVIDVGTVDLGDPDDVRILVRGFKGIRFGPELAGEAEGVPFHLKEFKKGTGVAWDELVDEIARAQSRQPKEVERELMRTLERYKALKEDKRAGRILTVGPEGEPPPVRQSDKLREQETPEVLGYELDRQTLTPKRTVVDVAKPGDYGADPLGDGTFRMVPSGDIVDFAERNRRLSGSATPAPPTVEPPPAPKFEETSFGTQALIPGAEKRVIPPTKLKAPGRQADVEDTPLFGQEKVARQEASDKAQGSLLDDAKPVDPDDPFGAKDILPDERGEPGEAGKGRAGVLPHLASSATGAALGGTQGDTPEERWRNAVIGAAAGLVAPPALKGLRAMGERGALGSEPPKVPPQFRREVVGRTPVPEVTPFDQMVPPEPPTSPAAKQAFRQSTQKVIQQAKAPESVPPVSEDFAGMAGGNLPPRSVFTLPADIPGDPMPEASRAARFFRMTKRPFDYWNVPEEVVRGDPAATAVVRLTYRRGEDGMRFKREFEDQTREIFRGLTAPEIKQISVALDTALPGRVSQYGGFEAARALEATELRRILPPKLAEPAIRMRAEVLDGYADVTGAPRGQRFASYFSHFRDTVRMEERKLVLNPEGEPYLSKTFLGDVPENFARAYFHKQRTASDPPSRLGLDAYLIYARATARHLTMQGGFHPVTREVIPGYLNELQGLIQQPVQEGLKPYLSQFVNDFLGATSKGSPGAHQASRIARNVEFARSIGGNLASPLVNMTGQVNTFALVRPQSWVRGYLDMLDPQRRALAQRFIGLEELAKADLELVQQTVTKLDRIEDFTGKLAHVSGTLFRASEKNGNRYHAFLAGLRDAEAEGLTGRAAIEYARDINDSTQFLGSGPAKPFVFRGPVGAAVGQFKQFQMRQMFFVKNLIAQDIKDWNALLHGQRRVPIEITGRTYRDPMTGEVFTRPARIFPRTAKYLIMLSAVGGPDAVWPGLEEYLQEKGVTVPGLLPAIGVGVNQMMGYGAIEPGDLTRSLLFYLPGPLVGHVQDMVSAARGIHYGRGLTELVNGDWGRELTLDERMDRALRGFLPVAGVGAARGRRAFKQFQTPGEERAALTILEALGLQPATGPILRRTAAGDPARTAIGLPPKRQEREFEERQRLSDLDARANQVVQQAADLAAAGRGADAERVLRDGEKRLGLPPNSLAILRQGARGAALRREFTPLERRRMQMRRRFPTEVERSRERAPGLEPEGMPRARRFRF